MATIPFHPMFLGDDTTENVTKKAVERRQKIRELVANEQYITISQIARLCGVSRMTINRDIEKLSDYLVHIDPKNGGHWEVLK